MRVVRRILQELGEFAFEFGREDVFHLFGTVVHLFYALTQRDEIELPQAVETHDLRRALRALFG